ncbi:MAG: VWA domain-containing protein [Ardenticatenaceae bacterium]|nr:VWA domain-containing protein [Anaerolineales bacterium]MCB8921419.1 VWA domain-containing protein [Ardenticatenaceae bacterium]MCB8991536.1 VWA domain-containing protein [Ardenticatenaceae bacterium]
MKQGIRFFALILLFVLLVPLSAGAQSAGGMVINYAEVREDPDALSLGVYFTVVDREGRPISNASIDSATIQIVGDSITYPAQTEKPRSPLYIALVLDASGSMSGAMNDMRQAAAQAISGLPEEARVAVVRFNENINKVQDFTDNKDSVANAINGVNTDQKGTCLYDATYQAIQWVNEAASSTPQARRAVIVFTDGRDELVSGDAQPCSTHSYQDVITLATNASAQVPVHTIGMSGGQNINAGELRGMAGETGGLSAIGDQAALSELFSQIIAGLRSQWLASARLYPRAGTHPATLSVTLRDGTVLASAFTFTSTRDYAVPPDPVAIILQSLRPTPEGNYLLTLGITSPSLIGRMEVSVWDGGILVSEYTIPTPGVTQQVTLETGAFEERKQYDIQVTAVSPDGSSITTDRGNNVLLEHDFRYDPAAQAETLITIDAVRIDPNTNALTLDMLAENGGAIDHYEVSLINEETNTQVYYDPHPEMPGEQMVSMPLETIEQGKYTIIVEAIDLQGNTLAKADYGGVAYTPPEPPAPPSLFSRVFAALGQFWYITVLIIVLILGTVAWMMFRSRQEKMVTGTPFLQGHGVQSMSGGSDALHRTMAMDQLSPDAFQSGSAAPSRPSAQPSLRVIVLNSPDTTHVGQEVAVTHFPFTMGREGCDLNFAGDGRVSRRHAVLQYEQGMFTITDMQSSNGTFIHGQRLTPHMQYPLSEPIVRVELGKFTSLELRLS